MGERKRLPLAVKPSNRSESTNRDAKIINGYVERVDGDNVEIYKRPGYAVYAAGSVGYASVGLGCYNWNGDLYAVYGPTLYKNNLAISGTVDSGTIYSFATTLGATPQLVLHNGVAMYTYDNTNGLVPVQTSTGAIVTGNLSNGSAVVTSTNTTVLFVGMFVTGTGIPGFTTIVSIDSITQFTMSTTATANGAGVSISCQTGFPANRTQGVVYLDGYINVMTTAAALWTSQPNLANQWPLGNNLIAQIESDKGVCLAKQLTFVVALKQYSIEFFYDAGNASGSPLLPTQGAKISIGCRSANSVSGIDGILFFVSSSKDGGTGVYILDSLKQAKVSTPEIDLLLQEADFTTVYSWCAQVSGHKWYCLTIVNANLSLVYDITSQQWYQWTDFNGNYLPFVSVTYTNDGQSIFQHATSGNMYKLEPSNTNDYGNKIIFDLYTPNFDGGTRLKKMVNILDVVSDQTTGSNLNIRSSDDDYQTWSNFRQVNLGTIRPMLTRCGTFRRRAYHFRHDSNTPLRIKAVELDIDLGTL